VNIDLTDDQLYLLLSTLAIAHVIQYLKGKDNSKLSELIQIISEDLSKNDKKYIFDKVFMQIKKW
jgi:hypothetical protein